MQNQTEPAAELTNPGTHTWGIGGGYRLTRYQRLLIDGFGIRGDNTMAYYWLTPPSRAVFFISVLLAVLALLVRYAHVAIPVVSNHSFETLLIAFLLLLAGNLFKGF